MNKLPHATHAPARPRCRSDVATMSRMLTRALIQSSAVAIHAAGPGAALVALQAAAAARRNLSSSKQVRARLRGCLGVYGG